MLLCVECYETVYTWGRTNYPSFNTLKNYNLEFAVTSENTISIMLPSSTKLFHLYDTALSVHSSSATKKT
jgi:hypothetical protein